MKVERRRYGGDIDPRMSNTQTVEGRYVQLRNLPLYVKYICLEVVMSVGSAATASEADTRLSPTSFFF